jgi:hypothetical protein
MAGLMRGGREARCPDSWPQGFWKRNLASNRCTVADRALHFEAPGRPAPVDKPLAMPSRQSPKAPGFPEAFLLQPLLVFRHVGFSVLDHPLDHLSTETFILLPASV